MLLLKKFQFSFISFVTIAAIVLILMGYNSFLLIISYVLFYQLLSERLSTEFFNTRILRFISFLVFYVALLQTVILSVWIVNHNFPLDWSLTLITVLLLVAWVWKLSFSGLHFIDAKPALPLFAKKDLFSLIVAFFILGLIVAAPLAKSVKYFQGFDFGYIAINLLNTSFDDSNHLSRVNDRLQLNRGVLYKTDQTDNVVHRDSISTYPPGWHSANAVLISALSPRVKVGSESLILYVLSKALWLTILVYLFTRITILIAEKFLRIRKKSLWGWLVLWLAGTTTFFSYYILLEQFKQGFYSFIPLLISLLLLVPLLMQLGKDRYDTKKTFRSLIFLLLILANITLTWFLVMPAVAFALVTLLVLPNFPKTFQSSMLALFKELFRQLPLVFMVICSVVVQIVMITDKESSRSFSAGVNDPGGITMHSIWYLVFIFIGTVLFYSVESRSEGSQKSNIGMLLLSLLGFALFIFVFQIVTTGHTEYYFEKTLNCSLIIALPLAIVGWASALNFIAKRDRPSTLIIVIGALLTIPMAIGIEPVNDSLLRYIKGSLAFSPDQSTFLFKNLEDRSNIPLSKRQSDTIFYIPGNVGQSTIATNIARSIQRVDDCDNKQFRSLMDDDGSSLFETIKYCQASPIVVVTKPDKLKLLEGLKKQNNIGELLSFTAIP